MRRVRDTVTGAFVNRYPWDEMQPGDFFVVPLSKGKTFDNFCERFRQVARRKDIELSMLKHYTGTAADPVPGVMVIYVWGPGVSDMKVRAGLPPTPKEKRVRPKSTRFVPARGHDQ